MMVIETWCRSKWKKKWVPWYVLKKIILFPLDYLPLPLFPFWFLYTVNVNGSSSINLGLAVNNLLLRQNKKGEEIATRHKKKEILCKARARLNYADMITHLDVSTTSKSSSWCYDVIKIWKPQKINKMWRSIIPTLIVAV